MEIYFQVLWEFRLGAHLCTGDTVTLKPFGVAERCESCFQKVYSRCAKTFKPLGVAERCEFYFQITFKCRSSSTFMHLRHIQTLRGDGALWKYIFKFCRSLVPVHIYAPATP